MRRLPGFKQDHYPRQVCPPWCPVFFIGCARSRLPPAFVPDKDIQNTPVTMPVAAFNFVGMFFDVFILHRSFNVPVEVHVLRVGIKCTLLFSILRVHGSYPL